MQGSVTVLITSPAAPNPPTVTVIPLYGCGYLLEIKSQATAGVGCDLTCVVHTTSLCRIIFFFFTVTVIVTCACTQSDYFHMLYIANVHIHNMGSNPPVYVCVCVLMKLNVSRHDTCLPPL